MGGLRYESMADMPPGLRAKFTAQQVAGQIMADQIVAGSVQTVPVAASSEKKSKYHNEKVTANGIRFDSKKEARRYL